MLGWGQQEKGTTEDEIIGWHHWPSGHEFGWTPGVVDGQGGLACCNSWGCKESDTTERLNCTESNPSVFIIIHGILGEMRIFLCLSYTKLVAKVRLFIHNFSFIYVNIHTYLIVNMHWLFITCLVLCRCWRCNYEKDIISGNLMVTIC